MILNALIICAQRTFQYRGTKTWYEKPQNVRNASSVDSIHKMYATITHQELNRLPSSSVYISCIHFNILAQLELLYVYLIFYSKANAGGLPTKSGALMIEMWNLLTNLSQHHSLRWLPGNLWFCPFLSLCIPIPVLWNCGDLFLFFCFSPNLLSFSSFSIRLNKY